MKFNEDGAKTCVSSTGALSLPKVPARLAIVGGGVIGLELGSVWARLGSKVTVIEFLDRICATMDKELTDAFHKSLKKNLGFEFKLKTKVVAADIRADGASLTPAPHRGPGS